VWFDVIRVTVLRTRDKLFRKEKVSFRSELLQIKHFQKGGFSKSFIIHDTITQKQNTGIAHRNNGPHKASLPISADPYEGATSGRYELQ
jgi:hypothetical protein